MAFRLKRFIGVLLAVLLLVGMVPAKMAGAVNVPQDELSVKNSSFEEGVTDGNIPGWSTYPSDLNRDTSITVTGARGYNSEHSVVIEDDNNGSSVGLDSEPIPITPGETYKASTHFYIEKGSVRIYLKYLNAKGKEIASQSKGVKTPFGEWGQVSIKVVAPEEAAYAKIRLYSGVSTISKAYYDRVTLELQETLDLPFEYGDLIDLGPATLNAKTQGAVVGNGEVYFATNGSPSTFYAVDASTGKVKFSQDVPGNIVVWALTVGSDGNVYFAGTINGILYRYLPDEKRIEKLGKNPSDEWVYDLVASKDGKIYGATFPHAKVFEYDIATDTFKDLGTMKEGMKYARGVGISGKYLYVGVGYKMHLYKINRYTYEKEEIITPQTGTEGYYSNVFVYGDKIFAVYGTSLDILNKETGTVIKTLNHRDENTFDGIISPPSPYNANLFYFRHKRTGELWTYNGETNQIKPVEPRIQLPNGGTKAMKWVTLTEGENAGHKVLAILLNTLNYALYDPQDHTLQTMTLNVKLQGIDIESIEKGPDGKIYMGGYQGSFSVYNPSTKSYDLQKRKPSQIDSIGFLNDKVYLGIYGGAKIFQYDPSEPYQYSGDQSTNNPGLFYDIGKEQSRVFSMASGDNKLFVGTIADYGELGGALSIYGATSWEWSVHRNIIQNQSIIGLAYRDGKVYGGSTIWGGNGIDPSEETARMFVYDLESGKAEVFDPHIPGINPQMIGELSFGPDGLLWGIAWGQYDKGGTIFAVFAVDPQTKELKKSKLMYHNLRRLSKWRPFFIRWGDNGLMYTTIGRRLTVIDPETLASKKLINHRADLMVLGDNGSIFFAQGGSHLYKLPVPLDKVSLHAGSDTVEKFGTAKLELSGTLVNGKDANLTGANIDYVSSNPDILTVENGVIKAHNLGTAEVYATVSLNGVSVKSNPLTVKIVPSLSSIQKMVEIYHSSGDLEQPLFSQLTNKVEQAKHHFNQGRKGLALKHMEGFLKHLNNEAMAKFVSKTAKKSLNTDASALIQLWEKDEQD